jgi:hypothetical protein
VIVFRNTDVDVPFFWNSDGQPAGRWHRDGEGPVQYTASTPSAAWAEFLRHHGITDQADLDGITRTLWAIDLPDTEPTGSPDLPRATLVGDQSTYPACQAEATRLRATGARRLVAPSAATLDGTASGWRSDPSLVPGPPGAESTIALFGRRPDAVGWVTGMGGHPEPELLGRVRYFARAIRP